MKVIINDVEYVRKPSFTGTDGRTLGQVLLGARDNANLSLEKAGKQIGCSKGYLWQLEKDEAEPSLRMAAKISDVYGLPIESMAMRLFKKSNTN